MIRKGVSGAWTPTASFSACVLSKVTLEGTNIDPSLQDIVEIPYNESEYIHHVGSSLVLQSTVQSGLIAGGKDTKE